MDTLINSFGTLKLTGNEKRIESCKKVGGLKKEQGHKKEDLFNERFCIIPEKRSTKAEADCIISPIKGADLLLQLNSIFGTTDLYNVSLKSGSNLQFHLGNIPDISLLNKKEFWCKYLAKSQSNLPVDYLVYQNQDSYLFFLMDSVIEYIINEITWRYLPSGRIKGDFKDSSKKGFRQYLTYEYRNTHKSYFLGANGERGILFIELLQTKIKFLKLQTSHDSI